MSVLMVSISGSLLFMKRRPLLNIFWLFIFCVLLREHRGMGGYSSTGVRMIFMSVALILGVKRLKRLSLVKIPLPFLIRSEAWPVSPVLCNLRPSSSPSLLESMFLPFTIVGFVLYLAMGIILNFSSLVCIFHSFSYLFILSTSLSSLSSCFWTYSVWLLLVWYRLHTLCLMCLVLLRVNRWCTRCIVLVIICFPEVLRLVG